MVELFEHSTATTLHAAGFDESTIASLRTSLREQLSNYKEPLQFLTSTCKQDAYFQS